MDDLMSTLAVGEAVLQRGLACFCILQAEFVAFASASFAVLFGAPFADRELPWRNLVATPDLLRMYAAINEAHISGREVRIDFSAKRGDGRCFPLAATLLRIDAYRHQPLLLAVTATPDQARHVRELQRLAFTDPVTGIANRACLLDELRAMLLGAGARPARVGLLLAEIFDQADNEDGPGRCTIVRMASCIRDAMPGGTCVARFGVRLLAAALPAVASADEVFRAGERLVREAACCSGEGPGIEVSIGIAVSPDHGETIDALFDSARSALAGGRSAGRGCVRVAAGRSAGAVEAVRFFEWEGTHNLGVADLDRDHREIGDLVNAVGNRLKSGAHDELGACMDRLVARTARHFGLEERLMERYPHARVDAHKAEHTQLLQDLAALGTHLDDRSVVLTMRYLQDWLLWHVDSMDRELARTMLGSAPAS